VTDLAITARCLEHDLLEGLEAEIAEHVLEVFVERRGTNPESGEKMARVGGPLRKLHADLSGGRSVRAVTWYDPGRDVCWLLAAGMHDMFYSYVEELARNDSHLPTSTDRANYEADAPIRLMDRVIRNATPALEKAIQQPGMEFAVTEEPPPCAYFRVEGGRLWVRILMYGRRGYQLVQPKGSYPGGGIRRIPVDEEYPADARWDSVYLAGPIPGLDSWPPPRQLLW
jgi:hypothetical protein